MSNKYVVIDSSFNPNQINQNDFTDLSIPKPEIITLLSKEILGGNSTSDLIDEILRGK